MNNIKKVLGLLIIGFLMIININNVKAASATIKVSSSSASVVVGNTITVTVKISSSTTIGSWGYDLTYDKKLLQITGGAEPSIVGYTSNSSTKTTSYTYKMKALKSGTATITVSNASVIGFDEQQMTTNISKATVKIMTKKQLEATYSKNNYLKSLKVEGVELTPAFNKDTLEYNIELPNETKSINILAEVEDSKSDLAGTGNIEVQEGTNKLEVKVTAQNGNVKTYVINATVKELNPINVKVDGKEYTIIRKKGIAPVLENYHETTIPMGEEEVLAYYSDITKYTLLALKDSEGNINYYIYNDDKYKLYQEVSFNKISLALLDFDDSLIPTSYKKNKVKINNKQIECYKLNDDSNYALLYGINMETGKKGLYAYDTKENTVQRYNEEEIEIVNKKLKTSYLINIGLIGVLVITLITSLIIKFKNKKNK